MADFLRTQSTAFPEQKEHFNDLIDNLTKKLWHQLGDKLTEIIKIPFFTTGEHTVDLYENVVQKNCKNINPQTFVSFSIAASKQKKDTETRLAFLEGIQAVDNVKEDAHASLLCSMAIARLKVAVGKMDECKVLIDDGHKKMGAYMGIMDASVQSHLYLASMEYYKANGPASEYFKSSLLYLTYTPLESIPIEDQVALAADVSLAAVVGESIYNFGELLQHPVAIKLHGTPQQWVADLLLAFNRGDIKGFKTIFAERSATEATLKKSEEFLMEKIKIMAMIEMVFSKDANSRTISFEEIASTCDCELAYVERLLMKCFSLGVLKGLIDQVESQVRIKWVQARVLDMKQLTSIRDRLQGWSKQVSSAATYLESNAPELLVA